MSPAHWRLPTPASLVRPLLAAWWQWWVVTMHSVVTTLFIPPRPALPGPGSLGDNYTPPPVSPPSPAWYLQLCWAATTTGATFSIPLFTISIIKHLPSPHTSPAAADAQTSPLVFDNFDIDVTSFSRYLKKAQQGPSSCWKYCTSCILRLLGNIVFHPCHNCQTLAFAAAQTSPHFQYPIFIN